LNPRFILVSSLFKEYTFQPCHLLYLRVNSGPRPYREYVCGFQGFSFDSDVLSLFCSNFVHPFPSSVLRVSGKWSFSLGIRGGNRYNGIKRPLDVKPALRWPGKPPTISTDPFSFGKLALKTKLKISFTASLGPEEGWPKPAGRSPHKILLPSCVGFIFFSNLPKPLLRVVCPW